MTKLEQVKRSRFKSWVGIDLAPTSSHHAESSLGAVRLKPPDVEVLGEDDDDADNADYHDKAKRVRLIVENATGLCSSFQVCYKCGKHHRCKYKIWKIQKS